MGYFKYDFGLKWQLSRHSSLHPINDMGLRVKEHQKEKGMDKAVSSSNCGLVLIVLVALSRGKGRRLRGKALSILIEAIRLPTWALIFLRTIYFSPKIYHEINHPPASRPGSKIIREKVVFCWAFIFTIHAT